MLEIKLPADDGSPQRLKAVYVSILSFMNLLSRGLKDPGIITVRQTQTSQEVPADARLVSVHSDPYNLHTIALVMEHESFEEVQPGEIIPELRVYFHAEPVKDDLVVDYLKDGYYLPDPDKIDKQYDPDYWPKKVKKFRSLFLKEEVK
jgi:hypothetical protein